MPTRPNTAPDSDAGPLTPVVFHTLLALFGGPLHGYAISQQVQEATNGAVRMGPGTLYGSLQRMQKSGLVEQVEGKDPDASHADRRRYYGITAAGKRTVRAEALRLEMDVALARARSVLDNG